MRNDEVKKILTIIHEEKGLTPENVVDAAKEVSHPLHGHFEWDDAKAGEKHRLEQARGLIRSVRIRYAEDGEGRDKTVRAFVSSRTAAAPNEPVYRPTEEVVADPFARQMLLREARREWMAFKRKYESLDEFASIVGGTDEKTG